jgi:hypothetical protein
MQQLYGLLPEPVKIIVIRIIKNEIRNEMQRKGEFFVDDLFDWE